MGGDTIVKLLLTVLVIVIVWRGFRLWSDMQRRVTQAEAEQKRQRRAPAPLDRRPAHVAGPTSRVAPPARARPAGSNAPEPRGPRALTGAIGPA